VLSLLVDLGSKHRSVLALVVEIKDKDAINSSGDQLVVLIVEVSKVYETDARHVNLRNQLQELVEKVHLEVGRHHQVESELVGEGYRCNLSMSLCDVDHL